MHMAASNHREQSREGRSRQSFAGHITRSSQNFGYTRGRLGGHFLNAPHQHTIINPRRDTLPAMKKGCAAGSAGIFKARTGNLSEPRRHADVGSKVILADEGRTSKIAQVEGLYRLRQDTRIR